ncbi:MAG: alpha/beta hydrolase [Candidatus Magnetoovum sp. WYHC-5]|nr:alpha/beta hydrolase [Candidatus Magnetoovum sp. WYHC-5]
MYNQAKWFFDWKRQLQEELDSGSKIAKTEKGPVEYAIYGDSGPVLACLHGAPGGYDQVLPFFSELVQEGFRILAWSRPGYLKTPLSVGRTVDEQVEVLASLLDSLDIDKVFIVGVSAGGPPAIQFAAHYPNRTKALVTVCAVSKRYDMGPEKKLIQVVTHMVACDPVSWLYNLFVDHWASGAFYMMIRTESTLDELKIQELVDTIMRDEKKYNIMMSLIKSMSPISMRKPGFDNDFEQYTKLEDLDFQRIQAPALVVHGTHDAMVPLSHAENIIKNVPSAELYKVEEGIHILLVSKKADEMTKKVLAFLNRYV